MHPAKFQLAVIIINYKTPDLIIDCVESVVPELNGVSAKIIIVDNQSGDNSCEVIKSWIDTNNKGGLITLIVSANNFGFSAGNNLGVSNIDADYYLLLNSDTLVKERSIQLLLNYAKKDNSAGLISPRLEWTDAIPQESCFKFHTPISEFISSACTGPIAMLFRNFVVPQVVSEEIAYFDWTSFACVLVNSKVFEEIGLLDDGYFMFYEDVEFCYRAKMNGWKVLNVPDAHVVHLRGGSSLVKTQAKLRKRLPRYFYESRTRFFYQIYGRSGLLLANILWTLGWSISSIRGLLSSSYHSNVSEYQWRDIWINFQHPLRKYIHPDDYNKT